MQLQLLAGTKKASNKRAFLHTSTQSYVPPYSATNGLDEDGDYCSSRLTLEVSVLFEQAETYKNILYLYLSTVENSLLEWEELLEEETLYDSYFAWNNRVLYVANYEQLTLENLSEFLKERYRNTPVVDFNDFHCRSIGFTRIDYQAEHYILPVAAPALSVTYQLKTVQMRTNLEEVFQVVDAPAALVLDPAQAYEIKYTLQVEADGQSFEVVFHLATPSLAQQHLNRRFALEKCPYLHDPIKIIQAAAYDHHKTTVILANIFPQKLLPCYSMVELKLRLAAHFEVSDYAEILHRPLPNYKKAVGSCLESVVVVA